MPDHVISSEYATSQRRYYDDRIHSLQDAQNLVGCYAEGQRLIPSILTFVLDECRKRRIARPFSEASVLDFGCGVGRIMEAAKGLGCHQIDGVDISESMLRYAEDNPALEGSRFFLATGADCGQAPQNHYDLITSFFCLQHICHHGNRMSILKAMRDCLNDEGVVALEMQYFPTATAADMPSNHAPWGEDRISSVTNSEADVWITPDKLGEVVADMSRYFHDISLQFVDLFRPEDYSPSYNAATRNYDRAFQHVYLFGRKSTSFAQAIYRPIEAVATKQ